MKDNYKLISIRCELYLAEQKCKLLNSYSLLSPQKEKEKDKDKGKKDVLRHQFILLQKD